MQRRRINAASQGLHNFFRRRGRVRVMKTRDVLHDRVMKENPLDFRESSIYFDPQGLSSCPSSALQQCHAIQGRVTCV